MQINSDHEVMEIPYQELFSLLQSGVPLIGAKLVNAKGGTSEELKSVTGMPISEAGDKPTIRIERISKPPYLMRLDKVKAISYAGDEVTVVSQSGNTLSILFNREVAVTKEEAKTAAILTFREMPEFINYFSSEVIPALSARESGNLTDAMTQKALRFCLEKTFTRYSKIIFPHEFSFLIPSVSHKGYTMYRWNRKFLENEMNIRLPHNLTWEDMDMLEVTGRQFIYYENLFYDVDCPDGVYNFFELPYYKTKLRDLDYKIKRTSTKDAERFCNVELMSRNKLAQQFHSKGLIKDAPVVV